MANEREELWKQAMNLLQVKRVRRKATPDEVGLIAKMSYDYHPAVVCQMQRDLKIYPLFDALAMWVQPKSGLAEYEPNITAIAKLLISEEERRVGK